MVAKTFNDLSQEERERISNVLSANGFSAAENSDLEGFFVRKTEDGNTEYVKVTADGLETFASQPKRTWTMEQIQQGLDI